MLGKLNDKCILNLGISGQFHTSADLITMEKNACYLFGRNASGYSSSTQLCVAEVRLLSALKHFENKGPEKILSLKAIETCRCSKQCNQGLRIIFVGVNEVKFWPKLHASFPHYYSIACCVKWSCTHSATLLSFQTVFRFIIEDVHKTKQSPHGGSIRAYNIARVTSSCNRRTPCRRLHNFIHASMITLQIYVMRKCVCVCVLFIALLFINFKKSK